MNRRQFMNTMAGAAALGAASSLAQADDPRNVARSENAPAASKAKSAKPAAAADPHAGHAGHQGHAAVDHSAHQPGSGRYAALASSFGICAGLAAECVGHCQTILATGDKSLAECLKSSLACDTTCTAVARLARLESQFAPSLAQQTIPVMEACMESCRPHVETHPICKACFDACNNAIGTARTI